MREIVAARHGLAEADVDVSKLIEILGVRQEFLVESLAAVTSKYGSFAGYLTDRLGPRPRAGSRSASAMEQD